MTEGVKRLGSNNTSEARQQIYKRARAALVGLVSSGLELASERLALEMAIERFEEQALEAGVIIPRAHRTWHTTFEANHGTSVSPG